MRGKQHFDRGRRAADPLLAPALALHRDDFGGYDCRPGQAWRVGDALHGGFVLALAMSAAELELDRPEMRLQHVSLQYLRPFIDDRVRVEVCVERIGRRLANATTRMYSGDRLAAVGLASMAATDLPDDVVLVAPPSVAPYAPEKNAEGGGSSPGLQQRAWIQSRTLRGAESTGLTWVAPRSREAIDHRWLAVVVDLLVPPASRVWSRWRGFQTVDLTYHARRSLPRHDLPPGSPVLVAVTNRVVAGGYVDEDVEIWSGSGDLLGQSRQTRILT